MTQTIKGFYDPARRAGQITHIAGSGQANKPERLLGPGIHEFNRVSGVSGSLLGQRHARDDRPTGDSFTTTVDNQGLGTFDCLTLERDRLPHARERH